ncbi:MULTISPECIES: conserved phage C-terminal domain-containing protein [Staphylococcus]|uniref:conserved phage C-terminal domain-containing protein n=1 Tax=Staphylococcus TaxID=1279 RepID=UPI002E17C49F|nr:conserved phage C-terminal domain-containing protein [Staphylococcus shinii]
MSKLLIDDYPILVLPKLAEQIGLNEAIVLQQMHYWLSNSNHFYDGRKWIYNSYKNWEEQFPFWSNVTIRRTISSLEKQNLLYVGNYNKAGFDKTKWYSIDYEGLEGMSKRVAQNEQTMWSKRANGVAQNEQVDMVKMSKPIPETNTEITSETSTDNNMSNSSTTHPYESIIEHLNQNTGKHYKSTTRKTKDLIKARFNEGFNEQEFLTVINNKVAEWKGTDMEKYLRPETLFGTKFESYLNQQTSNKEPCNNPYANLF